MENRSAQARLGREPVGARSHGDGIDREEGSEIYYIEVDQYQPRDDKPTWTDVFTFVALAVIVCIIGCCLLISRAHAW